MSEDHIDKVVHIKKAVDAADDVLYVAQKLLLQLDVKKVEKAVGVLLTRGTISAAEGIKLMESYVTILTAVQSQAQAAQAIRSRLEGEWQAWKGAQ